MIAHWVQRFWSITGSLLDRLHPCALHVGLSQSLTSFLNMLLLLILNNFNEWEVFFAYLRHASFLLRLQAARSLKDLMIPLIANLHSEESGCWASKSNRKPLIISFIALLYFATSVSRITRNKARFTRKGW